jgi:hypothetical protein
MTLTVTDVAYEGNGARFTFSDESVADTTYVVRNGTLFYDGLTAAQEAAVANFYLSSDNSVVFGQPTSGIISSLLNRVDAIEQTHHVRHFFDDDILVRQTEEPPVADPSGYTGWHFDNTAGSIKINWFYYNLALTGPATNLKVSGINSIWTSFRTPLSLTPSGDFIFINLFTRRKNDGNDAAINYRSRYAYTADWSSIGNGTYLIHFGDDPGVRPEIERVELSIDSVSTIGPQESDEEVLSVAISTSSSASAGANKFTVQESGFSINDYLLSCTYAMP